MSKYIFNNDTDILEFLEQLRENGIQIWGEGEKIRYRSKNRQLAPETLRILKMAKGQILDFFRMIEKNVIPLTSIQTAYVVGQTAGCELGNINAHYYIEYTIESLDVERLEQIINLVISKNDALRLIVTHEGKASFLDNVPYYSVPVYSLYDGNDREQKRLERSHHRYNYYKWPMFHFCVGKTSGKTSVLHVDFDCIILDAWSAKLLLNEIFSLYYGKDVKFPRISFMNYMRLKTDKGGQEIIERCHEDINVKKKYIIAFSEMASLCITKASELLGENIIINRIFLINPSKAKESDLYLGDISIIDGNSVAIKSWEKAVLGNVREFESNSNDIFDIIMRELENDK